jgi:hypothetical protein
MSTSPTTRSALEVALGFIGALLILPLVVNVFLGLVRSVFRFRTTRRLLGEVAVAGLVGLLSNEGVLDRLFGRKGEVGDGLFKPEVRTQDG